MKVETLNCPNCGAGVASDRSLCEFCRTRLKTVACPRCLGLMFAGNKFCGHCGAPSVAAEMAETKDPGLCPRCGVELQQLNINTIVLNECEKCGGLWSDPETFERVCLNAEEQSAAITFLGNRPAAIAAQVPVKYVPCPVCKQLMNRSNFARASGIIIDLCKKHGVWFDGGELTKILEFVDSGGLSLAREKERIALDEERQMVREERRRMELSDIRSGTNAGRAGRFDIGSSDLFKVLFDL